LKIRGREKLVKVSCSVAIFCIFVAAFFFLYSCRTGLNIPQSKIKYFDKNFSAAFDNKAFKTTHEKGYGIRTLFDLLEIYNAKSDSVILKFNDSGEMEMDYKDSLSMHSKKFKGKFTKEGYYEIYLRNKSIEIPPFLPIVCSSHHINRIRIAQTLEGDLIVDNFWNEGGNIFVFGGGDSGRRQSYFKLISNR